MPSDVTGFTMEDIATGELRFRQGAIMHQIVLADEINRTSPKTQSSLLEAMQEGQVTIDSNTYELPKPFIVLATQNPIEQEGTFPLPEAQLDRFFIKVSLGYPGIRDEINILERHDGVPSPIRELQPVVTADEIISMQNEVDKVVCSDAIKEYIALIVAQTRTNTDLLIGASPRGSIALMHGAKAWAYIRGYDYVTPDDVLHMTPYVLAHRLVLRPEAKLKDMTAVRILKNITNMVRIPDSL